LAFWQSTLNACLGMWNSEKDKSKSLKLNSRSRKKTALAASKQVVDLFKTEEGNKE
jgi:hypothetical protein